MAEQEKKETKYTNNLGLLIENVNGNVENLIIMHYAIKDKKGIILRKNGELKCVDALIEYQKGKSLTLTPVDNKGYDTSNMNTLLTAAKLIATVDEIAAYGHQEPYIYASIHDENPPLYINMKIKKKEKKTIE